MSQNDEQNNSNDHKDSNENPLMNDPLKENEIPNYDSSRIEFTMDETSETKTTNNASLNMETSSTIIEEIETKRKKSKKIKLGVLAVVACLLIIIGVFSVPAVRNVLSFSTKNPNDYLKSVLSEETKNLATYLKSNIKRQEKAKAEGVSYDMNFKVTLGEYAKQFLANDIIDLDNLNASMKVDTKGNEVNTTAKFSLNGVDLFSYIMLMSLDQEALYMQIPELSSAYLKSDLSLMTQVYGDEYFNSITAIQNALTPETVEKLSKNYINAILDTFDDVSLEKDVKVNVNVLDAIYDKLSVSFSEQDMINIEIAILKQALNDNDSLDIMTQLFQLVEQSAPIKEEIQANIDELEASRETASQEEIVNLSVYVDNKSLKGFDIHVTDDSTTNISFITAKKSDLNSLVFNVTNNDIEYASVLGKWDSTSTGETGSLDIKAITDEYSEATTSINISFQDLKIVNKELGTANGTILISSDSFAGISLTCSLQGSDNSQNISLSVNTMGMELGTLSIDYTQVDFNEIVFPATDAEFYDMQADMETYISNSNLFGLLYDLSEKLGIDLTSLFMGSQGTW